MGKEKCHPKCFIIVVYAVFPPTILTRKTPPPCHPRKTPPLVIPEIINRGSNILLNTRWEYGGLDFLPALNTGCT